MEHNTQHLPGPTVAPLPVGNFSFLYNITDRDALQCYSYKAPSYNASSSPLIMVLHGMGRNAEQYRDFSEQLANNLGALTVAPYFDQKRYPSWDYRTAGVFKSAELDVVAAENQWLSVILFKLVMEAKAREGNPDMPHYFFGHSAGAQCLHRVFLFQPDPTSRAILVANPGSLTFPNDWWPFPYGFHGVPSNLCGEELLRRYVGLRLLVVSGSADVLQTPNLDTSEAAMKEGKDRRERAEAFFHAYHDLAAAKGWAFNWSFVNVPNVGHEGKGMLESVPVEDAIKHAQAAAVKVIATGAPGEPSR